MIFEDGIQPAPGLWKSTSLERFAWLSIAAALATIALKASPGG